MYCMIGFNISVDLPDQTIQSCDEVQSGSTWYDPTSCPLISISQIRRDDHHHLLTWTGLHQSLLPALDDLSRAQLELDGFTALIGVKDGAICQEPLVSHQDGVSIPALLTWYTVQRMLHLSLKLNQTFIISNHIFRLF